MSLPHTLRIPHTLDHPIKGIDHGPLTTVEFVVIHINQGTTHGTFNWWALGGAGHHEADGAQVQVSRGGVRYQTMGLDRKAWHAGNANDRAIGFEHEGFAPGTAPVGFKFLEERPHVQLHASANGVAWVLHECNLGRPKLNGNIFAHAHGGASWGGHDCPGTWPWHEYMQLVTAAYMGHWGR